MGWIVLGNIFTLTIRVFIMVIVLIVLVMFERVGCFGVGDRYDGGRYNVGNDE